MSADLIKLAEDNGFELDHLTYGGPIFQVKGLYTFTSDSVCLAKFVDEENIGCLVDFCSGSGIVGLEVAGRIKTQVLYMFEIQKELFDASSLTASLNEKLCKIYPVLDRVQNAINYCSQVDCVVCNPPYFKKGSGILSDNISKNLARHELELTLEEIFISAKNILRKGGSFYLIHIFSRDKEILKMAKKFGFVVKKEKFLEGKLARKIYKFVLE